ncbi:glycoside hydrolase family 65 protein [Tengunoibacter tsumagoiensis]|uniref:Kojibiose phosphorylase n=1 Tax=Tengunoibacter tsumagoiensis TaxID=2014871 RepID=A0A402A0H4_9CHLR|nr:glycoside hydrolase family 65 protein [Tengunoibacter tsumagoiensis]GCE12613.1 kojibiose phosphorylase [Tengunoibacter tsumagoiensis]
MLTSKTENIHTSEGETAPLWTVYEDSFDPTLKKLHSQETVYTIGNGYFCTRGTFEEGYPRADTATLLYGVFDQVPIAKEELANIPDWTEIKLFVNDERFRLDRGTILDYHRSLDLTQGLLSRSVSWESPNGVRISINSQRFASLADEHVGIIRFSITVDSTPDDQPAEILIRSSFNTAQGNYNLMHVETVDQAHTDDLLWLHTETKRSLVQLAQTMSFTSDRTDFRKEILDSDISPSIRLYGSLKPGESLTTEKVVVMYTSRDGTDDVIRTALEHHRALLSADNVSQSYNGQFLFESLLTTQREAWAHFWQEADILVEGDDKAQVGLRYSLYQLRINTSSHDTRYSIAAKGLTGFGYRGHVFHDTEIFMLPFFTYVLPDIARNLLLYRYHLLPAARKKAASNGYEGAQYPWESTLSGDETTPPSIIHPETGELIPVLNGFIELHITSSIAHATWEYWRVSGDDDFLQEYGAEVLLSTAQYWASRVEKNPERTEYEITNVIGPDEWHEHVNNNAYTNYMARNNIQCALQALDWLKTNSPTKARQLVQQLNLTDERLAYWQDIIEHIRIPQNPETGLFEQFEGFFDLPKLDQSKFEGRKDSYQGILGVEVVQRYQIVKQADVLMLLTVLEREFDLKTKEVNWDYYYPITDHAYGSSLTPALHVILASQLGRTADVVKLFLAGALVDLENLRGNTPEGVHAACAGAVWQAAILGIAGLRVDEHGYTTNPHWPDGWKRLAFSFKHKGEAIHVDLHR